MDETARNICERAFQAVDRVDQLQAEWQAERRAESFDQRYQREAEAADAFLAERERKRLVFKQFENAQTAPEVPQPKAQRTAVMDDALETRMRSFAMSLGETLATVIGEKTGELETRIKKLEQKIAALKAAKPDVSLKGVVPLRDRNAA